MFLTSPSLLFEGVRSGTTERSAATLPALVSAGVPGCPERTVPGQPLTPVSRACTAFEQGVLSTAAEF
jgi:hypothetical protein